jgi:hypothetical protein
MSTPTLSGVQLGKPRPVRAPRPKTVDLVMPANFSAYKPLASIWLLPTFPYNSTVLAGRPTAVEPPRRYAARPRPLAYVSA